MARYDARYSQVEEVERVNARRQPELNLLELVVKDHVRGPRGGPAGMDVPVVRVGRRAEQHGLKLVGDVPELDGVDIEVDEDFARVVARLALLLRASAGYDEARRVVHVVRRGCTADELRRRRIREAVRAPRAAAYVAAGEIKHGRHSGQG